ncbi:ribonuclease III [Halobacteriovorax marinus]|uniref:Ribonuclease 3 n=1 Tax=Halobacteriovorax marinus TaxID=97084 RepID=A0A1Y5FA72_9BACT|nr:ribonuclease III [Halobacteriovorax marinus]
MLTLLNKLSYTFNNLDLLYQALSHSSFAHEYMLDSRQSYETLEFLGDSVLSLIVIDELLAKFPALSEGQLSKLRASLVNESSLEKLAKSIALENVILVGKGELKNQGNSRSSIMADVLEALLGAIYKDSNLESTRAVFHTIVDLYERESGVVFYNEENIIQFDSKTRLQELTMALYKTLPTYKSRECEGAEFEVSLWLDSKLLAQGIYQSKKKGERELAAKILKELETENKKS